MATVALSYLCIKDGIEELQEKDFRNLDALAIIQDDIEKLLSGVRDQILLRNRLFPLPSSSRSTRSPQSSRKSKRHRSRSSSSGEFTDSDDDRIRKSVKLPKSAYDLPQPHTFVHCRKSADSRNTRKPEPLDLQFEEFMVGAMSLLRRLARSEELGHRAVHLEYLDYVEYLCQKRKDYFAKSIIGFDDEFRKLARRERLPLNDVNARQTLEHQYFNSTTLL